MYTALEATAEAFKAIEAITNYYYMNEAITMIYEYEAFKAVEAKEAVALKRYAKAEAKAKLIKAKAKAKVAAVKYKANKYKALAEAINNYYMNEVYNA